MNAHEIIRDKSAAEKETMLIIMAVARGLSTPMRASLMKQLGIIVPNHSEDAGRPYNVRLNDV